MLKGQNPDCILSEQETTAPPRMESNFLPAAVAGCRHHYRLCNRGWNSSADLQTNQQPLIFK